MKLSSTLASVSLAIAALSLSACGTKYVSDAQVAAVSQNGQEYGNVSLDINTNGLTFTATQFVIPVASNPSVTLASVALTSVSTTESKLAISLDLTAIAGITAGTASATLPNGLGLPVSDYNPATLLTFNPAGSNSKIYVDLDTAAGDAMVGGALVISEFNIGATSDLFVPFTSKDGSVSGTAGIFTGATADQSGFAFFLGANNLLPSTTTTSAMSAMDLSQTLAGPVHPSYNSAMPSKENMKRMHNMYKQLLKQGAPLHVK